jgi:hypothetical protein
MTIFDSDPSPNGPSFEELNLYNELVLHAGELAEALQSHDSVSTDRYYRVSDPRLMAQLTISDTISQLGQILPDEQPSEVTIHCTVLSREGVQYGETRIHLDYRGEKFFIRSDENAHYLVADTPSDSEDEPYVAIDPRITSDLIAKLTVPYTAPELCDFTELNDISRINEICASLENSDFVDGSIEHTYKPLSGYTVITETKKEPLVGHHIPVSIEITEDRDETEDAEDRDEPTDPLNLKTEFSDYRSALGMLRILTMGSEEVTLDIDHMRHFRLVLMSLLASVRPDSISLEDYEADDKEDEDLDTYAAVEEYEEDLEEDDEDEDEDKDSDED